MMMRKNYLLIVMLVLLQAGCSIGGASRPAEFYVLNAEPGTPVSGRTPSAGPLSVGLGPVSMPDIFDRPQIVTRPQSNRLEMSEFDRWGGDLNRGLSRVLVQNLMSRLNTDSVLLHPWSSRDKPDFQVTVQVFRFDGEVGNVARFEGVWRLIDGTQGCELAVERFRFDEKPAGPGYPEFVSAMSHAVAKLSQAIAERVATTKPGCGA
ncbi:MAG TPA: membrane integrity-associated transporter subunit PqiC [Gammaproteobacteria bacterium]|nr:membrane integrity-associated transporter subunit PqiC [Gammaproteobacteria bacterium]